MRGRTFLLGSGAIALAFLLSMLLAPLRSSVHVTTGPELVILNGRVMDPDTNLDALRDVGIAGGKIIAVSEKPLEGREKIDAQGLVVVPGFIDLHQHGQDAYNNVVKARDGVTTVFDIEGGPLDIDRWYAEREGKALINYGAGVRHGAARIRVMNGPKAPLDNPPVADPAIHGTSTKPQMADIQRLIGQGLERGAVGVGIAAAYTPGASHEEILETFRTAAKYDATVHAHIRYSGTKEPESSIDALEEVIADAAISGASLHVNHISSMGVRDSLLLLDMIAGARSHGLDITTEAYPYGAAATDIAGAILDPGWQQKLGIDYHDIQWVATGERLNEENFTRYRKTGGGVILHFIPEEIVRGVIANPLTMIASDGGLSAGGGHPRTAGTYGRVLGYFVREEKALSLMEALRKMTLMPAQRLEHRVPEMKHKGRIQVGADADITIFDPGKVIDRATYENPAQPSEGFRYVMVNGVLVVKDGQVVEGVTPGRPVRAPVRRSR